MPGIEQMHHSWLFIVPIYNLKLCKEIQSELTIDRVTFISTERFRRVRKRFGVPSRLSELRPEQKEFFEKHETLALVRVTGAIEDIRLDCLKLVEKELNILFATFVGYSSRSYKNKVGIAGDITYGISENVYMSTETVLSMHRSTASNYRPIVLDNAWELHQKNSFLFQFLAMIKDRRSIQRGYRKELLKAVELMGKSFNSNDIVDAFLWNMIAIELLITGDNDKHRIALINRLSALFGWMNKWEQDNYREKIDEVYKKRNDFVHDADSDAIEVKDLLFTDEILLNLIINIIKHPNVFTSKDALIEFTKKVEAEHILNLPGKIHPKSFTYVARRYTDNDLNMLQ